jgi:arsenate reductase (thioredoxin)
MKHYLLFLMGLALINSTMGQENKIIFVCEHGAAKSVIAAAYFNKLAKERNLNYVAECRGTSPDETVSKSAKDGLTSDKLYDPAIKPQKLLVTDTTNVKRFILFTPLPPEMNTSIKTENWSQLKNLDADYDKRRDVIVKKINELLDSLEKQ